MDLRFIVHEHHASRLHYDFRLEMGGVFKSWAIPKGPSMNPGDKRLAIMVEDHSLEYGKFEGIIPAGHYGAGPVVIWDQGSFVPREEGNPEEQLKKGRLSFQLKGKRLKGGFSLAWLKGRGKGNQWILIKRKDEQAIRTLNSPSPSPMRKRRSLRRESPPARPIPVPHSDVRSDSSLVRMGNSPKGTV